MPGNAYPKVENDWQNNHYSGEDRDLQLKIERIINEWEKVDQVRVPSKLIHTKKIIQHLIDTGQGSLLFYTGRSRRQIEKKREGLNIPESLNRYIQHLNEQSKNPHTLDLIIRAILNSRKLDKHMKEYMLTIFQIERARRIRSKSGWNNNNLDIAERIILSAKHRFRHSFYEDGKYNYVHFDDKTEDKQYFIPIRCLPTFIILQEALCSYRRCDFNVTLGLVEEGLNELEKTKSPNRFYAYHLIEWWFYYVQARVYESTYETDEYDQTKEYLRQCETKMHPKMEGYLVAVSVINENQPGQEKYRLLREYHIGLHLFIYNGPSSKEKSEALRKRIEKWDGLPPIIRTQKIRFFDSVDEKLIRAINGFKEEEKGRKKTLPKNFKFHGLWSRSTSLKVNKYLENLDKSILCAEILLISSSERKDHLMPSILTLIMIDVFTKLRFLFNGLVVAQKNERTYPGPDYQKYKERIQDLVTLSHGIIENINYDTKNKIPLAKWISDVEIVLEKVKLSSIEDLGFLVGSFIGFEYIDLTKDRGKDLQNRFFRERRDEKLVLEIKGELKSDIERKLTIERLSKKIKLDYIFTLFLISENKQFLTKELDEYEGASLLKKEINEWSSMNRDRHLLQLCVPKLDEGSGLIRFSAKPECLFMIGNDNNFTTYRGIVGERNIRS